VLLEKEKRARFIEIRLLSRGGAFKLLKKLRKAFEAITILDLKTLVLKVLINRNQQDKLLEATAIIDKFNKNASMKKPALNTKNSNLKVCVICTDEIFPDHAVICTSSCNHLFHKECYKSFLQYALQPGQIPPILCPQCNASLSLRDLHYTKLEFHQLAEKACNKLIADSKGLLGYCGMTDCSAPLRLRASSINCWSCKINLCGQCLKVLHPGVTCAGILTDFDKSRMKVCPNCNMLIEKNGGCNHMVCGNCRIHFCWKCCEFMSTNHGEVYTHMHEKHGNIYD